MWLVGKSVRSPAVEGAYPAGRALLVPALLLPTPALDSCSRFPILSRLAAVAEAAAQLRALVSPPTASSPSVSRL